jgi:acyl-CoA reductase-like NAD-dependent aldehyde dehydrogenase
MRDAWRTSGGRGAALIAALAVGLAACGGSDDDAATTATVTGDPAPGQAEYVAEADAFCTRTASNTELSESLTELRKIPETSPAFPERAAAHFRLVRDLALDAREELAAIEPPDALRPRVEDFLEVNDEAIEELRAVIAALERGETADDSANAYARKLAEADRLAEAIGFEVCGRTGLG